jgi:hypothetical protein
MWPARFVTRPAAPLLANPRARRLALTVLLGLLAGLAVGNLYWAIAQWTQADAGAYWNAALRLRAGEPLYPPGVDLEASDVYRYAPWFAWLAVPFTYLPVHIAGAIWSAVLVAASTIAVVPLARRGAWVQVLFFWPILIGISATGNVQALLIAWLVWGVERRSGPLWIALAASLKVVPLALVLVYAGRRQWLRAGATLLITAVLVAPALFYDLRTYPASAGYAGMLITWPVVYILVLAGAALISLRFASSRYGWLAASTTAALALPRFFTYDVTLLMVGVPWSSARPRRSARSDRESGMVR